MSLQYLCKELYQMRSVSHSCHSQVWAWSMSIWWEGRLQQIRNSKRNTQHKWTFRNMKWWQSPSSLRWAQSQKHFVWSCKKVWSSPVQVGPARYSSNPKANRADQCRLIDWARTMELKWKVTAKWKMNSQSGQRRNPTSLSPFWAV